VVEYQLLLRGLKNRKEYRRARRERINTHYDSKENRSSMDGGGSRGKFTS